METPRRRTPLWKIGAVFGGALALGCLAFWLWVGRVETRKLVSMERRVEELIRAAEARAAERLVLRGESLPGNAWDVNEQDIVLEVGPPPHPNPR